MVPSLKFVVKKMDNVSARKDSPVLDAINVSTDIMDIRTVNHVNVARMAHLQLAVTSVESVLVSLILLEGPVIYVPLDIITTQNVLVSES